MVFQIFSGFQHLPTYSRRMDGRHEDFAARPYRR